VAQAYLERNEEMTVLVEENERLQRVEEEFKHM